MKENTFRIVLPLLFGIVGVVNAMNVDIFVHKDKFGKSLQMDIGDKECTNVPRLWANLTMSVDTHGSCMQFYDGKSCKGKIAVIQPFHTVHQMDLSLINFHNTIQSISPCGAKVPSGRYVIQSAVDASILTVQKHENEFARVNTLPPTAFVPKAQQWEVSEKARNEYDIMPRIHETNYPITYDGEAMKKGSFIRKVWKIESVGRGRYIIKSEWTQKCLYKTRVRTVEEHDCRAWSPNQEWVLRPMIAPTKPPPTQNPQLADGVNFQVPSKVVDKYLAEQKRLREKNRPSKKPSEDGEDDHIGAYLEPYRIVYKKDKNRAKEQESSEEEEEDLAPEERFRKGATEEKAQYQPAGQGVYAFPVKPPGPEVMYSQPYPMLKYMPGTHGKEPAKDLVYMDGIMPIYEDAKAEDPIFPDFLLHAASDDKSEEDEKSPTKYAVTRKPFRPVPTGHPDYKPDKKKYDGRVKDKNWKGHDQEEEKKENDESGEDSAEDEQGPPGPPGPDGPPRNGQSDGPEQDEESEESQEEEEDEETEKKTVSTKGNKNPSGIKEGSKQPSPIGHVIYQSFQPAINPQEYLGYEQDQPAQQYGNENGQQLQEQQPQGQQPKEKKKPEKEQEQSQEDDAEEEESQEDDQEENVPSPYVENPKKERESLEEGDDPAKDVASFMKLLFKGINNKMGKKDKVQNDMVDLLDK